MSSGTPQHPRTCCLQMFLAPFAVSTANPPPSQVTRE